MKRNEIYSILCFRLTFGRIFKSTHWPTHESTIHVYIKNGAMVIGNHNWNKRPTATPPIDQCRVFINTWPHTRLRHIETYLLDRKVCLIPKQRTVDLICLTGYQSRASIRRNYVQSAEDMSINLGMESTEILNNRFYTIFPLARVLWIADQCGL